MTRALVVWEDTNYQPLAEIVNIVVRKLAPDVSTPRPVVLHHTARSNTAFGRYVETTWPNASRCGLPMSAGPIDHVVCVVDADKLGDLLPQAAATPPLRADDVGKWHVTTEQAWATHLRGKCPSAGPPSSSVHGVVLRWSKESAVLSGYDQASFAGDLDCDITSPEIRQFLAKCQPSPLQLDADSFANSYRNPMRCLRELRKAAKLVDLTKNAPQIDDVLRKLGRESLSVLCKRTPDIPRIAELIWKLHSGADVAPDPAKQGASQSPTAKKRRSGKRTQGRGGRHVLRLYR